MVFNPTAVEYELQHQLETSRQLLEYLKNNTEALVQIADVICQAYRQGKKVMVCGNGGSASDAQHIVGELMGKYRVDRAPLPALALSANVSVMTSIANDYDYEYIFARQLQALVNEGDVVIGLSTSGRSRNVIEAIKEAKKLGAITVALTGQGGELANLVHYALEIPSEDTPRIQEAYLVASHMICYVVEKNLFSERIVGIDFKSFRTFPDQGYP
jgi:D-sedoheptulose 7-phosphate isomerase